MGFWRACSVSLEIERLRLASVAKWALAKQRMRTSRNQNTFERSTLIRVAGPFYLHQSQLSLPSRFLVTYSFCFKHFFCCFSSVLIKEVVERTTPSSVSDGFFAARTTAGRSCDSSTVGSWRCRHFSQIWGGENRLKHAEKRPRGEGFFFGAFCFVRRCWPFFARKKNLIHWYTLDDQDSTLSCWDAKMTGAKIRLTPFDLVASRPIKGLVEFGWIFQDTNWSLVGLLCWPHIAGRDEGKRDCTFCL